jgi:hypothetical protein
MKIALAALLGLVLICAGFAEDEEPSYSERNSWGVDLPDVVEGEGVCCAGFIVLPAVLLISVSARIRHGSSR